MSKHHFFAACLAGAFLLSPHFGSVAMAEGVEGEEHCVVKIASWDRLNVRSEPYVGAELVTQHRYGDCGIVVIGECEGNWCPIEDGHFNGWVNSKYISMVSPAMYCVTDVDDDDFLNLRAYPATTSKIIAELAPDQCDIAFLPYAVGNWQKVRADGYEGWVNGKYLSGQ
jgi:SH3-like domain-containing protein